VLFKQIFEKSAFSFWLIRKIASYKYRILSDYLNIRPVDEYIFLPAENTEATAFAVNDDTAYLRIAEIYFNIIDKSDPAARFYADYLFASYVTEMAHHNTPPPCFRFVL
jgi:hypothetical protein